MTANVTPEIAHTPAASPSMPSRKLTMFMTATIQTIVSVTPIQAGRSTTPTKGNVKWSTQTPKAVGNRRREHLAGELGQGREAAEVVDGAHDARHGGAKEDAAHLAGEVEERERRHDDAEEDREPAEPRDRTPVESALVGRVDDPEQARHAADGRSEHQDHDQRDRGSVEDLRAVPKLVEHARSYFVPYRRSPASPRPGTM